MNSENSPRSKPFLSALAAIGITIALATTVAGAAHAAPASTQEAAASTQSATGGASTQKPRIGGATTEPRIFGSRGVISPSKESMTELMRQLFPWGLLLTDLKHAFWSKPKGLELLPSDRWSAPRPSGRSARDHCRGLAPLGHSGAEPALSSAPGRYAFVRIRSPSSSLLAWVQHLLDDGLKLARQRRYRSDARRLDADRLHGHERSSRRPRQVEAFLQRVGGSSSRLGNPRWLPSNLAGEHTQSSRTTLSLPSSSQRATRFARAAVTCGEDAQSAFFR